MMAEIVSLPNGLRLALIEMPESRYDAVFAGLPAGPIFDPPTFEGSSAILTHLHSGALRSAPSSIRRAIDALPCDHTCVIHRDRALLGFSVAPRASECAVDLLAEMLGPRSYSPGEIDEAIEVVVRGEGFGEEANLHRMASLLLPDLVHSADPSGTEASREMCRSWIGRLDRRAFGAQNIAVAIAGPSAPRLADRARRLFSALPRGAEPVQEPGLPGDIYFPRIAAFGRDPGPLETVSVAFLGASLPCARELEEDAFIVLLNDLTLPLGRWVRYGTGFTYYTEVGNRSLGSWSAFWITATARPAAVPDLLRAIGEDLDRVRNADFSDEALLRAVRRAARHARARLADSSGWASQAVWALLTDSELKDATALAPDLDAAESVTAEAVAEAAGRLAPPGMWVAEVDSEIDEDLLYGWLEPGEQAAPGASRKTLADSIAPERRSRPPLRPRAARRARTSRLPELWAERLPNGLVLLAADLPDARAGAIAAAVRASRFVESERTAGISHLLEHLHATPWREAWCPSEWDDFNTDIQGYAGDEAIVLHTTVQAEEVGAASRIFVEILRPRQFSDATIEIEKELLATEILTAAACDDGVIAAVDAFFGVHPVAGTETSLASLAPAEVRAWDLALFRPDRMVVALAGPLDQIDLAGLKSELMRLAPAPGARALHDARPELAAKTVVARPPPKEPTEYLPLLGFVSPRALASAERAALMVLERVHVLRDLPPSGRLYGLGDMAFEHWRSFGRSVLAAAPAKLIDPMMPVDFLEDIVENLRALSEPSHAEAFLHAREKARFAAQATLDDVETLATRLVQDGLDAAHDQELPRRTWVEESLDLLASVDQQALSRALRTMISPRSVHFEAVLTEEEEARARRFLASLP